MIDDAPLPAGHGETPADASDVLVGEIPSEIELVAGHLFWATQQSEEEGRSALAHIRNYSSPEQLREGARLLQQQGRSEALIAIERWTKELNAAAVSAVKSDDAAAAGDAECSVGAVAEGDVAVDCLADAAVNIDADADGVPAAVTDTATSRAASADRSVDTFSAIDAVEEVTGGRNAGANNFPKVGDLVWRSPIPSEWNSKTQQRKPSQPGCVCRVVQLTNNGAIALCEENDSRFHISWHAWESGLFAPYRGQDGR